MGNSLLTGEKKTGAKGAGLRPPIGLLLSETRAIKAGGGTTLKNMVKHAPYSGIWGPQKLVPILRVNT